MSIKGVRLCTCHDIILVMKIITRIWVLSAIFFAAVLFLNLKITLASVQFTRQLSLGMSGEDVRDLQKTLNTDPMTQIQGSGAGSPGQETDYFGELTKDAVIRLQEEYSADILAPIGLNVGSGFVGQMTLKKLNNINASKDIQTISPSQKSTLLVTNQPISLDNTAPNVDIYATDRKLNQISGDIMSGINQSLASGATPNDDYSAYKIDANTVFIKGISAQQGPVGTSVNIQGNGLTAQSMIYFGQTHAVKATLDASGSLTFIVPAVPLGRYDIAAVSNSGVSNTVVFVVLGATSPGVFVNSIQPNNIKYGQAVTVYGSGFSPSNNEIVTDFGRFPDLSSSDGKTLVFTFAPETLKQISKLGNGTKAINVGLSVISDYGIVNKQGSFTLNI